MSFPELLPKAVGMFTLGICLMAGFASAQQLDVFASNKIAVEENVDYTTSLNGTDLGLILVGQSKQSGPFYIENSYNSSISILSITINGPDASRFAVSYFPTSLQPGSSMSAYITATPNSVARFAASVTITTNLTGGDATYTFPISCNGVNSPPNDLSDIYFAGNSKPPKFKTDKKTGAVSIQVSDSVGNAGPVDCSGGVIVHFNTNTRLLYLTQSPQLLSNALKPIPAPVSGKKPKLIKTKAKLTLPANTTYVFTIAGPEKDRQDTDWSNNVIRRAVVQ